MTIHYPTQITKTRTTQTNNIATLAEVKESLWIDVDDNDTTIEIYMTEAKKLFETRLDRSLDNCIYEVSYDLRNPVEKDRMELVLAPVNSVSVLGSSDTEVLRTTENGINSFLEYDTDYSEEPTFSVAVTWSDKLDLFKTIFFFCSNLYASREGIYGSQKSFPSNLSCGS